MKRKNCTEYFKQCFGNCSVTKCLINSIVFCVFLLFIDQFNLFTSIIERIGLNLFLIVLFGGLLISVLALYKKVPFFFKSRTPNSLDCFLIVLFFTLPLYVLGTYLINVDTSYKSIVSLCLILFIALILLVRAIVFNRFGKKEQSIIEVDLKHIYEDAIVSFDPTSNCRPLIIAEKDVDYDLLERNAIINNLYNSIVNRASKQSSFVIGLEGAWGSGKTTIINNVKRILNENNPNIRMIDDFDPWTYGSEKALLSALYDSIIVHSEMKSNYFVSRKAINEISNVIADNYVSGSIAKALLNATQITETETINKLKNSINNFLITSGTSVVVFIDNIDRANAENVVFLMKIISVVFNIPRLVFVLAYDNDRMSDIMKESLSINPKYMEKIINQVITIPKIQSESLKRICSVCFDRLLLYYGVNEKEVADYQPICDYICKHVKNLREFKRLVNSVFPNVLLAQKSGLQLFDLLAMQVILFTENEVYHSIFENKRFFISEDSLYDRDVFIPGASIDKFNKDGSAFFDALTEIATPECMDLLSCLFTYVERYQSNCILKDGYSPTPKKGIKTINSAKYFELYFSLGSNDFLSISQDVESVIEIINHCEDPREINDVFSKGLYKTIAEHQYEWLTQLNLRINEICSERGMACIKELYNNIYALDNGIYFMSLSPRELAIAMISDLLLMCSQEEAKAFFDSIKDDYRKVGIIRKLVYWIKAGQKKSENRETDVLSLAQKTHESVASDVVNNTIDLYADEYYCYQNVYGLFFEDENKKIGDINGYISKIASKNNVIRIMADMMGVMFGGTYTYYFKDDTIRLFFNDDTEIETLLFDYEPKSDAERFVLEVFENYKNGQPNVFGEKGVTRNSSLELDL